MAVLSPVPTAEQIRANTERVFGMRPCISQLKAAIAQLKKKSNVHVHIQHWIWKDLMFWIPIMIYERESITILITALNVLGHCNVTPSSWHPCHYM
jgi:hypothetical protein